MENQNTTQQNPAGTPQPTPVPNSQQSSASSVQQQISGQPVSTASSQTIPQQGPTPAMQIQQLLVQQQQYQQQYNQIVTFLQQNPNQTPEKTQEIKLHLDQLNSLYLQTQAQLKSLGYNPVQVNKPTTVKEGAKTNFSFKKLAIGCGFLLILLIVGFGWGMYYLIQNPNALTSVGITAATAKNLLSVFAGLFFGVFGLVGLGLLLSNIYRLITVKNQSKLRYIFGLLGAFLILWVVGGGAGLVFSQIGKIETEQVLNPEQIVFPYLIGKDGKEFLYQGDLPLIAPSEFSYKLQSSALLTYATKNLGEVSIQNVTLNCGNPQQQKLSYQNNTFVGRCLYGKKGDYPISLDVSYLNLLTNERQSHTIPVGTLQFTSEIHISLTSTANTTKSTVVDSTGGEFILGKAPAKITIDTTSVFRDFGLQNYNVLWDMDGDDSYDRENLVTFDYIYKLPKVYYPNVKFPDLSEVVYAFPVRVEQSDVPICDITLQHFEQSKYKIQTNFLDGSASSISSYSYNIIDTATNKSIEAIKKNTREIDYVFPEKGNYIVALEFITVDGKKGYCESDTLQLAKENLEVKYVLRQKLAGESVFKEIPSSAISGTTVTLSKIPQAIQLELTSITPSTPALNKNVYVDGKVILNQGNFYEFEINQEKTHTVEIKVEEPDLALTKNITLSFIVDRPEIIGELTVTPDIWYEPLTVTLDASKTTLTVPDDEIIYFSRDFGDGEVKKNLTNGVITHTYKYDYSSENGEFKPKVSISTRKGYKADIEAENTILVKKQLVQVDLSTPSHPTQIAKAGDQIQLLAEFNGLPDTMIWDFGDKSELMQCKGRSCTEVTKMYVNPGTYTIKLTLEFEDMQSIDTLMELRIN